MSAVLQLKKKKGEVKLVNLPTLDVGSGHDSSPKIEHRLAKVTILSLPSLHHSPGRESLFGNK